MEEKILTKRKVKDIGKKLDKIIDFTKIFNSKLLGIGAEIIDGMVFTGAISYVNNNCSDNVPERFHNNINEFMDCFLNDDYSNLIDISQETISEIGNIKFLPDQIETVWIKHNLIAIVETIKYYAEKNKQ